MCNCKRDCRPDHMRCGKKPESKAPATLEQVEYLKREYDQAIADYNELAPTVPRDHWSRKQQWRAAYSAGRRYRDALASRRTNEGYDFRGIKLVA